MSDEIPTRAIRVRLYIDHEGVACADSILVEILKDAIACEARDCGCTKRILDRVHAATTKAVAEGKP